jgi:hypothetical protein
MLPSPFHLQPGDHIVSLGIIPNTALKYLHHAIFVGHLGPMVEDMVIHVHPPPGGLSLQDFYWQNMLSMMIGNWDRDMIQLSVIQSSLASLASPLFVVPPYLPSYCLDGIVSRAYAALNTPFPWNCFSRNCEHFVTGIIYGYPHSLQERASHNRAHPIHWNNHPPTPPHTFSALQIGAGFSSIDCWVQHRLTDGSFLPIA